MGQTVQCITQETTLKIYTCPLHVTCIFVSHFCLPPGAALRADRAPLVGPVQCTVMIMQHCSTHTTPKQGRETQIFSIPSNFNTLKTLTFKKKSETE